MTHSFWATMGGISIDHNGPDSFIPGFQNPTLTPKGISFLVKHSPELLPDISEEELKDRSKANSFTKIVACIQASWFCLSCIARWSQKLPVSLLELNVFTHALCAVLTYLLWWSKPFDVRQPFALRDDRLRPLLAYMWMSSETSHRQEQSQGDHTFKCGGGPEFEAIIDDMASTELNHSQAPRTESPSEPIYTFETIYKDVTLPFGGRGTVSEIPTVRVTDSQSLPGARFRANSESTRWRTEETWDHHSESPSCNTHIRPKMFFLTSKDVRRWKLAREAMDQFHLQKPNGNLDLVTYDPIEEVMDLGEGFRMIWGLTALSVVGTLYGGLHALAWDSHFPNHRELILWRASTLIIACPAVTGTILFLATVVVSGIYILFLSSLSFVNPTWKKARNSTQETPVMAQVEAQKSPAQVETIAHVLGTFLIQLAVGAFLILYLASRGYLVVESFRTAFFLPPEAYQATRWTRYFPHIS
jgi:hypothetical protein